MHPVSKAIAAQSAGWLAAAGLLIGGLLPLPAGSGAWPLVCAQAVCAAGAAALLRSARWWLAIHAAFFPLILAASALRIAPGWYLLAFLVLGAVYWTSFRTQVPLYLSNRATARAVAALLPAQPVRLLDLGSGTGALLVPLARARPDCRFTGIEAAPLPYLASRLIGRHLHNLHLQRGDFFAVSWHEFDVIYAFLSPVPMARVWRKALTELPPGGLLLSNSFPVPDIPPLREITLPDPRATRLYLYRVPPRAGHGK